MRSLWVLLLSLEMILLLDHALCKSEESAENVVDPKLKLKDAKPEEHPNPYNWHDGEHPRQYDPSWSEEEQGNGNPYDWQHGAPPAPGMDGKENPNPYDWQDSPYKRHMEMPEGMRMGMDEAEFNPERMRAEMHAGDHPYPYDRRDGRHPKAGAGDHPGMEDMGYQRDARFQGNAYKPGMHAPNMERRGNGPMHGDVPMRGDHPGMDRRGFAYARPWGKDRDRNNRP